MENSRRPVSRCRNDTSTGIHHKTSKRMGQTPLHDSIHGPVPTRRKNQTNTKNRHRQNLHQSLAPDNRAGTNLDPKPGRSIDILGKPSPTKRKMERNDADTNSVWHSNQRRTCQPENPTRRSLFPGIRRFLARTEKTGCPDREKREDPIPKLRLCRHLRRNREQSLHDKFSHHLRLRNPGNSPSRGRNVHSALRKTNSQNRQQTTGFDSHSPNRRRLEEMEEGEIE